MSYGLRVWDEAGNITLDVNDRTYALYAIYTLVVDGGNSNTWVQSITVPGASLFAERQVIVNSNTVNNSYLVILPTTSWNGDTLTLVFDSYIYSATLYYFDLFVLRG